MRSWIACALLSSSAMGCASRDEPAASTQPVSMCAPITASWVAVTLDDAGSAAPSGMLACPASIDAYCAASWCPPPTWSAVVASFHAGCPPFNVYRCGAYNIAVPYWVCGGDDNVEFLYDATSGNLLAAVESKTGDFQTCLAGPAAVVPRGYCTDSFWCGSLDGGVDIESSGDAAL